MHFWLISTYITVVSINAIVYYLFIALGKAKVIFKVFQKWNIGNYGLWTTTREFFNDFVFFITRMRGQPVALNCLNILLFYWITVK